MSCLDVMYHQSYGAPYLPTAAYKATHCNHQQQKKLNVYSKMQECMEQQQHGGGGGGGKRMLPRDQGPASTGAEPGRASAVAEQKDVAQPAEAEYLSSRCVLFTYFKGDIGDEVDEHFSRALSQSSTFGSEAKSIRVTQPSASNNLWKDGSLPEAQGSSAWSGVFSSQTNSCLPAVSVSVHPEFSSSPVSFSHPDGALWAGHMLSQASIPSAATLPDTWTYSLSPQSPSGYPHEVYHPHPHSHPHIHPRHHPMLHSYPPHSPALDPRFNALLLPHGVRSQSQVTGSTGSSPHSEGGKTEMDLSSNSPVTATSAPWSSSALHGSLEVYDSAIDQTKVKTPVWF